MKTINISGFGGGYEWTCQKMLENGEQWIKANPEKAKKIAFLTYENVTGIAVPQTSAAEELDQAIMEGIEDATGAMHHAVTNHLRYIATNGREKWIEVAADGDPSRIYDFDGSVDSCPKTPPEVEAAKEKGEALLASLTQPPKDSLN